MDEKKKDVTVEEKEQPNQTETTISKDETTGDVTIKEEETPTTETTDVTTDETPTDETPAEPIDDTLNPDMFVEDGATEETPTEEQPVEYDLSSFGFAPEQVEMMQPSLDKFREAGMNQEQVEVVMDEIIGQPVDFKAQLSEGLSLEEKKNYRPLYDFLVNTEGNTEEEVVNIMKDVASVRFLNRLFNRIGNTGGGQLKTPKVTAKAGLPDEDIKSRFREFSRQANVPREKRVEFIDSLVKEAQNKDWATGYFKQFI